MDFLNSARRFLFEGSNSWINRMIAADETRADDDARLLRRGRGADAMTSNGRFEVIEGARPVND